MGSNEFVVTVPMPFTGESIVDGILVNWLVEPGERVRKGQNIAEIETEKSVWEFEAPCTGEVVSLRAEPGDVVEVKAPLLDIKTGDEGVKHLLFEEMPVTDTPRAAGGVPEASVADEKPGDSSRLDVSPRVKKLLRDAGIDSEEARTIPVAKNRLSTEDVEKYIAGKMKTEPQLEQPGAVTCYIAGFGAYVPDNIVENSLFTPHFPDIDEEYIEKVTGIRQRRWVNEETTSDMAYAASKEALDQSGLNASDLDMIILATTTPDMPLPASACMVQKRLGCRDIPAFDMQAACSGWIYALSVARQFLQTGACRNILVIASESMSKFTDQTDRATAFLFGDGAGAAIVSSSTEGHKLTDIVLQADSSGYDIIYRKAGGSMVPPRLMDSPKDEYWFMDGGRMFRSAVAAFSQVIEAVAEKAKTAVNEFTWFVPHQANSRILKSVASRLRAAPERFFSNIRLLGNTSAASIPLALKDLEKQDKVKSGDKVLLCAVGAGLTSAGCVIYWK